MRNLILVTCIFVGHLHAHIIVIKPNPMNLTFGGPDGTISLLIVGDEPYQPYDRPPLSKQVLKGWVPAEHTELPRMRVLHADWRLGVAATRLRAVGFGATRPREPNTTIEGRARNRRVELVRPCGEGGR